MMAPSSPVRGVESAFRDAVAESVARLELCDRNLITFHYFHGVGVDQLAEMFSLPPAGMARQLTRIRERLLRDIRRSLAARQPLDKLELDRLVDLARHRFELVIARVLRT